ncbi:alpha/beta hydrolase [Thiobacter aerophilum]|uniref:Xaa-Pro dipeptidyl-peptidase-like domain-containing protein n=1 Tax=Thiobacter aerophilum TaxID=3121275 RepID=A0ABV0EIE5_9BURK
MTRSERIHIAGPAGKIQVFVETREVPAGIALIAHLHPLYGGTADNKVVTTLAQTFRELGCATLRPNFRGVGGSEGEHDHRSSQRVTPQRVTPQRVITPQRVRPLLYSQLSLPPYLSIAIRQTPAPMHRLSTLPGLPSAASALNALSP